MADAPTLELRIQSNSEKAIQGLKNLATSLDEIKSKLSSGLGVDELTNDLEKLQTSFDSVFSTDVANRITKVADALEKISRTRSGGLSSVGKIVRDDSGVGPLSTEIMQARPEIGGAAVNASDGVKSAADGMRAAGSAVEEASQQFGKASEELDRIKESADGAKEATNGVVVGFSGIVKAANKVISPLDKVIRAFGRIAFYRVIRSILKYIGEGFKEGIANVRAYSAAINGSFNVAMTQAEATLLKVNNSLGAALAPVLQAIIPVLQTLASWFITVINLANQLVALLTGKSQWTRATDASADSIDNVGKAAGGAAKKVKNLLAGFDELNIIQSESGGGGGGGAKDLANYTDMFEEVFEFDGRIKAIAEWLKANGPYILDVVKNIGIAFATWRLSQVLPGDLGEILRYIVGLYIAYNGLKDAYQAFVDQWNNGVDLENMKQLLKGGLIMTIGLGLAFGAVGAGVGLLATGIAEAVAPIKEFIETGELSKEAIEQLRWAFVFAAAGATTLATKSLLAGAGVGVAAYFFVNALQDIKDQWENGVTFENMRALFDKLKWGVIALGAAFGAKGLGAGAVIAGLAEMIAPIKELVEVGSLSEDAFIQLETGIGLLTAGITALTGNPWVLAIGGIIAGIVALIQYWPNVVQWWDNDALPFLQGMWDTVSGALSDGWENLKKGVSEFWENLKKNNPTIALFAGWVEDLAQGFNEFSADPQGWFDEKKAAVLATVNGWLESIGANLSAMWNNLVESDPELKRIVEWFRQLKKTIGEIKKDPGAWFSEKWNGMIASISEKWAAFVEEVNTKARADKFIGPIIEFFEETWPKLMSFFEDPIGSIETAWENLKIWFYNNIVVPFNNFFINIGNSAIEIINNIIRGLNSISFDAFGQHIGFNIPEIELLPLMEELSEKEVPMEVEPVLPETVSIEEPLDVPVIPELPDGTDLADYLYDPENDVEITFALDDSGLDGMTPTVDMSGVTSSVEAAESEVHTSVDNMINDLNRLNDITYDYSFWRGGAGGSRFVNYSLRADGGFVGTGDMFIARESGPELVGRIGNRTAVANNDQIVAGVASGVASGQAEQNALLRQQNDLLRQMVAKSGRVEAVPSAAWGRFIRSSSEMYANNAGV